MARTTQSQLAKREIMMRIITVMVITMIIMLTMAMTERGRRLETPLSLNIHAFLSKKYVCKTKVKLTVPHVPRVSNFCLYNTKRAFET